MAVKLTGYKAGIDNAYKGKPNGGKDTSSMIDLDERYATIAIPLDTSDNKGPDQQRTSLNLGDIPIIENAQGGKVYKSLALVTDFGTLPHGDIDVAKGALQKNLNLEFIETKDYVNGVKGAGEVSMRKLASVGASGLKKGNFVNEAILKVNEKIKAGKLVTDDEIQADLKVELQNLENLKLAQAHERDVKVQSRSSYGTYDDVRGNRRPAGDEYAGYLQKMIQNPETRMMGFFLMLVGLMTGMLKPEDLGSSLMGMLGGEGANKGYGNGATDFTKADNAKYNGKGVLGGKVSGLAYELPKYSGQETSGQYFADCAKKFIGQHEQGGANCGPIVAWTMANAGLGEGEKSYWCAGFISKMYEGTGLYNYTASALNFAEQGMATGSFRQGTTKDIAIGDTVVFSYSDGGHHVGIVTAVDKNGITTVEGNSGDKVAERHRSFADLAKAGSGFLGYVDISDRETKLGLDIKAKLSKEYSLVPDLTPNKAPEVKVPLASPTEQPKTSMNDPANAAQDAARFAAMQAALVFNEKGVTDKKAEKDPEKTLKELAASAQIDVAVKGKEGYPPSSVKKVSPEEPAAQIA